MSAHFWLSPLAVADVEEIGYYVARDDPGAAERLVGRFFAAFTLLAEHPHLGRQREEVRQARSFVIQPLCGSLSRSAGRDRNHSRDPWRTRHRHGLTAGRSKDKHRTRRG